MSHGAMSHGALLQKGLVTLALVAGSMVGVVHAGDAGRNLYQPATKKTTVVAAKPVALKSANVAVGTKTAGIWGCQPVMSCPTPNYCYPVSNCQPSYYRPQYPMYGNPGYVNPGYGYGTPGYGYTSPVMSTPVYSTPSYGMPAYGTPVMGSPVYSAPVTPVYSAPIYGTQPSYISPVGVGLSDPFSAPVSHPGYFGGGIQPAVGSPYFP